MLRFVIDEHFPKPRRGASVMPKVSQRSKIARFLRHSILLDIVEQNECSFGDERFEELEEEVNENLDLLGLVVSTRYLAPRSQGQPKHKGFLPFLLNAMPESRFGNNCV